MKGDGACWVFVLPGGKYIIGNIMGAHRGPAGQNHRIDGVFQLGNRMFQTGRRITDAQLMGWLSTNWRNVAAISGALESGICPYSGGVPGAISPSPVEIIATRGRRAVTTVSTPVAAMAPICCGVKTVPATATIAPARVSSARRRIFLSGTGTA